MVESGFVSIVGAGPGSSDLLTLKALKCIEQADIILFDALIGEEIRNLFPKGTPAIFCGKRCGRHSMPQDQINRTMIRLAKSGHHVVRLKGGDPLIFGRGGEEALALHQAGIAFEMVPGLSAMNSIGALAGIPLTHRDLSRQIMVMEGHTLGNSPSDWDLLASFKGTLVIYMGTGKIQSICRALIAAGAPLNRPLALVESDGTVAEFCQTSNLEQVARHGLKPYSAGPGIIYIGEVVNLHHQLATKGDQDAKLLAANLS